MSKRTLQYLRTSTGLTQKQAAKKLGVTSVYLCMLEAADRNPSDSLKIKMAKLYNCEISDIFLAILSTKRLKRKEN